MLPPSCGTPKRSLCLWRHVAVHSPRSQARRKWSVLGSGSSSARRGLPFDIATRSGFIDWKLVACTAAGAAVAAWYGTDLMKEMSNQNLTRIFGILLVLAGLRMLTMKVA